MQLTGMNLNTGMRLMEMQEVLITVAQGMGYRVSFPPSGQVEMNFEAGDLALTYPDALTALLDWYEVMHLQHQMYGWWTHELAYLDHQIVTSLAKFQGDVHQLKRRLRSVFLILALLDENVEI